ncbi:TraB/GumN family protein [Flavobacterium selenitireducens]|uniref:TraB/GumN family protein n=1 Tax=Flavobacterium selenitireducens TaxID=2722704 RepID=UPI00168BCBAD|nr:TraB/GumN family protein [Flavobacterium selenitireducens]MBD3583954.1 TraB/GumN family protein [Flavobacterium selenitireducens]
MKNLFLTALVFACAATNAQALEKTLLWKISGNGLKQPSYLYGTIHITCDATLHPGVEKAMAETQQLYLEIDMDDPGMQSAMMNVMMMSGGKKMSTLASPDDVRLVDDYVKANLGMPLQMMDQVKPIFISMMFLTKLLECPIQSVEDNLMKLSAAQKEEVFGLETVEQQMAVLDAVPYEEQMNELVKSVKSNLENDKKETNMLVDLYKAQDIEGMLKAARESDNVTTSKYENELLTKRNQNWIPKIAEVAKQKPTFFGVGAAHLAGDNGVIKLLRKKGFKVEAVK